MRFKKIMALVLTGAMTVAINGAAVLLNRAAVLFLNE